MSAPDQIVLKVNGAAYFGWTEIRVTRSLKSLASDFDISVSERWAGQNPAQPWQIKPFDSVTLSIGDDLLLTGYVDSYDPSYDAGSHRVRIAGRSKTCDLVDGMPDNGNLQYNNYTLDKIAGTFAGLHGLTTVLQCPTGDAFSDATIQPTETCYSFLEKLARQRSIILTDDEYGNLVLTQAGINGTASALIEGQNILAASARLSANKRFSNYAVLSQTPEDFHGGGSTGVQTQIRGDAPDPTCPRYRHFVEQSEDPLDSDQAKDRALWRALHNWAEETEATITAAGWRQADGTLWEVNKLVPVTSPMLGLDRQMLIGSVEFALDDSGCRTVLQLAPQEAFSPNPNQKKTKQGSTAPQWHEGPPK